MPATRQWITEPLVLEHDGGRVSLQPMHASHACALYDARGDESTWRYMPAAIRSPQDADRLVEEALASKAAGSSFPFVVVDRYRNRIVGSTRFLDLAPEHRSLEIGYTWIEPAARRTSINTECKLLLLEHAFETLGCVRVQIKTDTRNEVSRRAIERIGFVKEGILRKHRVLPDGFVRDSVYYSLVREEWDSTKARLEEYLARVPSGRPQ